MENKTNKLTTSERSWVQAYLLDTYVRDCFNFKGTISRKQFWLSIISYALITLVGIAIIPFTDYLKSFILWVSALLIFVPLLPLLSMQTRRLHDIGKSGAWIFLHLIPVLGQLYLLILFCRKGKNETVRTKGNIIDYVVIAVCVLTCAAGYLKKDVFYHLKFEVTTYQGTIGGNSAELKLYRLIDNTTPKDQRGNEYVSKFKDAYYNQVNAPSDKIRPLSKLTIKTESGEVNYRYSVSSDKGIYKFDKQDTYDEWEMPFKQKGNELTGVFRAKGSEDGQPVKMQAVEERKTVTY